MAVPYPLGDPERDEVGRTLREAQRLLTVNEVRASILEVRRALEWVRENVDWDKPGSRKQGSQCNQTERWWRAGAGVWGPAKAPAAAALSPSSSSAQDMLVTHDRRMRADFTGSRLELREGAVAPAR
ncbi:hypothetical protein [Streptomyces colonosanans]|nr:hypothetical protein [Streptomyces colonosanans]